MEYLTAFALLWLWRYLRLIINCFAAWTFKPIPLPGTASYSNRDVTVIIPTLANSEDFRRCLLSVAACHPHSIIVVTPKERVGAVRKLCDNLRLFDIEILGAPKANKRLQMIQGLKRVRTSITVFADDDVFWPSTFLEYSLAPFEDPNVGASGTLQTLERPQNPNFWDFLSATYLERRTFEVAATSHIDGGSGCLSGRTFNIRTSIVQDQHFIDDFNNEKFLGRISLVAADDDNFVTRFLVNHGWKIAYQLAREAELFTTLENNPKFLGQCIRWRRTTWRSNFTSLVTERTVWRDQPYTTYAVYLSSFNPPAAVMDSLLAWLLYQAIETAGPSSPLPGMQTAFMIFLSWLLFSKVVKVIPHLYRYPSDLKYIPVLVAFGYLHGIIYLYTLLTLHKTTWGGGRAGIVSAYEKSSVGAILSSGYERMKESTGLKRVGSSATDLHRLGEKSSI